MPVCGKALHEFESFRNYPELLFEWDDCNHIKVSLHWVAPSLEIVLWWTL